MEGKQVNSSYLAIAYESKQQKCKYWESRKQKEILERLQSVYYHACVTDFKHAYRIGILSNAFITQIFLSITFIENAINPQLKSQTNKQLSNVRQFKQIPIHCLDMSRKVQSQVSEETHLQNILLLMETQRLEFDEAQQAYNVAGRNISKALQQSIHRRQSDDFVSEVQPKNARGISGVAGLSFPGTEQLKKNRLIEDQRIAREERDRLERNRINYRKAYIIKKQQKPKVRALNYRRKQRPIKQSSKSSPIEIQQQLNSLSRFQQYVGGEIKVAFSEQLSDCFEQMWNTKRMIAVHSIHIVQTKSSSLEKQIIQSFSKDVYLNPLFGQIFNKQFINYVLDPKTFQYHTYPFMRQFVNVEKDRHTLIILRLNQKMNEVVCAKKINLIEAINNTKPEAFHKSIQVVKKDINRIIDQQVCPSIIHNPLGQLDKKQLDESRRIRRQQQKQYSLMQKKMHAKEVQKRQKRIDLNEESDEQIQFMKQQVMKQVQATLLREQSQIRKALTPHKPEQIRNPITIKLRLPNGDTDTILLPKTEKVEYVFSYVKSREGELGFQNQAYRNFDIVQPWQSNRSLQKSKQKTLGEIFGESDGQTLVIKQF